MIAPPVTRGFKCALGKWRATADEDGHLLFRCSAYDGAARHALQSAIREGLRFLTPPIRSLSANVRQIPCSLQPFGADIEAGFNAKTGITETCDGILQPQPQKTCSSAAAQEY
jgi:hypothetical protein